MNSNSSRSVRPGLSPGIMWFGIAVVLLVPAVAMRFTREVDWTAADFLAAALLLGATGLVYQIAVRRVHYRTWRLLASTSLLIALLAIWAQGAVGIF